METIKLKIYCCSDDPFEIDVEKINDIFGIYTQKDKNTPMNIVFHLPSETELALFQEKQIAQLYIETLMDKFDYHELLKITKDQLQFFLVNHEMRRINSIFSTFTLNEHPEEDQVSMCKNVLKAYKI